MTSFISTTQLKLDLLPCKNKPSATLVETIILKKHAEISNDTRNHFLLLQLMYNDMS
uniref:Uncharacterized protein n=1 Tax=Arundo donax TaxID=35708 RepID=A0A0A9DA78_ARUDO